MIRLLLLGLLLTVRAKGYATMIFLHNIREFRKFPANRATHLTRLGGKIGASDNTDNCYHVVATLG